MAIVTTTHYVPDASGWSHRGYYFRLKVIQDYDNVANQSTLTVSLESYNASYSGTHNFLDNSSDPAYIKADGITLVTLGTSYKITYNASTTWQQIKSSSGSGSNEWTHTVSHDNSGNATVNFETAGRIYMYYNNTDYYGDMDRTNEKGTNMPYTFTGVRAFSLSISAGANSSIAVRRSGIALSSTDPIYYGDALTITFGADEGYNLSTHTVNDESFISGGTHTVYGDVTVKSAASLKSYSLTIEAETGSTITVSRGDTALNNGDTIYHFDVLTITFGAEEGYNLGDHTVNNKSFISGKTHTVKGAVSVVSTASLKSYTLTIKPDAHSVISVYKNGTALSSVDTIYHFDSLAITVTANGGYKIKSAYVNDTDTPLLPDVENNYEVDGDVTIVAISSALGFVYIQGGGATPSPYIIYVGSEDGLRLERYRVYIGTESNGVIPY